MESGDRLRRELAEAKAECDRLREENAKLWARLGDHNVRTDTRSVVDRKLPPQADKGCRHQSQ